MKITDIQMDTVNIPLVTPFKTALRTVTQIENVMVRVKTDTSLIGYGGAAPTAAITGRRWLQSLALSNISATISSGWCWKIRNRSFSA